MMWSSPPTRQQKYAIYLTILTLSMILGSTIGFTKSFPVTTVNRVQERASRGLTTKWQLAMSSKKEDLQENGSSSDLQNRSLLDSFLKEVDWRNKQLPPIQVDDTNLLFYDIFLIINLSASISFWVVHRMDLNFIGSAFSEGCLMSIMWIAAGLYTGAFLYSAVDGHFASGDERGGPKAAGLLGFHTFLNAVNLRLVVALISAILQHRPVGTGPGEDLLPIEIGFGMVLMGCWRLFHSTFVPRM